MKETRGIRIEKEEVKGLSLVDSIQDSNENPLMLIKTSIEVAGYKFDTHIHKHTERERKRERESV